MSKEFQKLVAKISASKDNAGTIYDLKTLPKGKIVSTGSLALDLALGGGLPDNRVGEIAGPEGAGKTTLCFKIVENFLTEFPESNALWLDCEGRLDIDWLEKHIPDESIRDRIIVALPDNAEQATDIYEEMVRSGEVCVVIWDSIGGVPTKANAEKSAVIGNVGGNAKAITRFANSAGPLANKYRALTIGINQVRDKIGARYPTLDTPGGHAWKHACSFRIWLKPEAKGAESKYLEKIQGQDVQVGYRIQALVVKCSFAPPNKSASWWFYNVYCDRGFGIDTVDELVRLSVTFEVVEKRGGWYYHESLPGGKVNGEAKLVEVIKDDETAREAILAETRNVLKTTDDISEVVTTFDPEKLYEEFTDIKPVTKVDYDNLLAKNAEI